ncbi:MAG: arylsulfatase [Desulfobacula sp.]|uniref:arylsulfatase n=1 Tax=Desulfobacula sp. TaxID=2593537 RepID=UPI0025B7F0A1|nr:arylsulfatase [Desulfobacula sp.]MCD4718648.1 arylsulfatase [Desulfobacula sp.]
MKKNIIHKFFKGIWIGMFLTVLLVAGCATQSGGKYPDQSSITEKQKQTIKANKNKNPNVLVVLLDDTGYADIGAYGSEIDTPNIDSLARNGLRYNNFHATPTCSPTRAAVLTGREPHRVGMGLVSRFDLGPRFPAFRGRIDPAAATVARVLQNAGYGTYALGKWHLTPPSHLGPAGSFENWPLGKGFDRFYGFMPGSTDQFAPELIQDNKVVDRVYDRDYNLTRDLVDNAITMLRTHQSYAGTHGKDRPFFMYIGTPGMHAPHQAPQKYLDKYRGRYDEGWDVMRAQRFARQKEMGLIPQNAELPENDKRIQAWESLDSNQKKAYARLQEVYAGFLDQTDVELGRLFNELKALGELDNTLIVVMSDNGGSQEGSINGCVNHSAYYAGQAESVQDLVARLDDIGGPNSGPNYPIGWSQVSNTPFPYFKQDTYGGGINVPFIVHWPAKLKTKNEVRTQYHHATDVMPTILELLDLELPDVFDGYKQLPVDGISMAYTFDDPDGKERRTKQFYRMGHNRGIYHDGWTAVARHKSGDDYDDDKWSLYNLEEDFVEANDLSAQHPDKLKELKKLWKAEAKKVNADYMIDPKYPGFFGGLAIKAMKAMRGPKEKEYLFYSGTPRVDQKATPKFIDRPYTITIPVVREKGNEEGVLFANGNDDSGFVIYIKDDKAVFEYNYCANVPSFGKLYKIESTICVPAGKSEIQFEFEKTGKLAGIGKLFINGKEAGRMDMPKTIAGRLSHEGLDIGRDGNTLITTSYTDSFPFTGQIEKVAIWVGIK